MPGLAAACGAVGIPKGAMYVYSLSWLVSTVVGGFSYWACWKIWPCEVDDSREQLYVEGLPDTEGSIRSEKEVQAKEQTAKQV